MSEILCYNISGMTRVKKISISFLGATVLAAACLFALMFCFGTGGDKTRSVTARAAYSLAVGAARDGSGEHEGHGAGFTAFDGRKELTTGNYYLTGNTATRETLVIPLGQKVTLCLNGYVLKGSGGAVIRVYGELTVCDCYLNTDENRHFFSDGSFTDGEGNFLTSGTDLIEGGIITGGVGSGTVGAITNRASLRSKT